MTKLEEIASSIWETVHPDAPWDSAAGPGTIERRRAFESARAAIHALRGPTDMMLSAAAGALKAHIDALPAEVRAKSKERGGVVFVGPVEKHAIRFNAMLDVILNEAPDTAIPPQGPKAPGR